MRQLLISEVFPPQNGGSGRWFWEIYRRLPVDTTFIAAGEHPQQAEFDSRHSLNLVRLPLKQTTWGAFSSAGLREYNRTRRAVRKLIRDHRIDVLHCGKVLPEGFAAWLCQRQTGIPYLCYVHGEELNIAAGSRQLRWMTQRVLQNAAIVIANSHNTAALLREGWRVADSRLEVLHPGVDITAFCPAERDSAVRTALGWNDRPVILTVSRLQARKGQDQMIRAMPQVREQIPNVLYSIVGDGEERSRLIALVQELGLQQHVEFRREVTDAEMIQCYQQCDVFVLPNRTVNGDFEGFGMVLLEAQACGKPVIAGISGGTRETMKIGATGRLVDCDHIDVLSTSVCQIMSDEIGRTQMGQSANRWVSSNFAWETLSRRASDFFCNRVM